MSVMSFVHLKPHTKVAGDPRTCAFNLPFGCDEFDGLAAGPRYFLLDLGCSKATTSAAIDTHCSKDNMSDGAATQGDGVSCAMRC
jgi:hypothetical protein